MGEQMVSYQGYYSNKARGMRRKAECDDDTPVESSLSSTAWRKNWAKDLFLPKGAELGLCLFGIGA